MIDIRGTPSQMGASHGEELRIQISELYEHRMELLRSRSTRPPNEISRICDEMMVRLKTTLPDTYAEVAATSVAAQLPRISDIIVAGAYSDLDDLLSRSGGGSRINECSLATIGTLRNTRIVGTWDSHKEACRALVVCRRTPVSGPRTLALTTAGWPAQQGISEQGAAIAITNLVGRLADSHGLPYIAAIPSVIAAPDMRLAVMSIARVLHASARFYLVTDGLETCGIEVAPGSPASLDCSRIQSHTNHFLHPSLVAEEGRPVTPSSIERLVKIGELELGDKTCTDIQALSNLTSSAVMQTDDRGEDKTGAAFVLNPINKCIVFTTLEMIQCGEPPIKVSVNNGQ